MPVWCGGWFAAVIVSMDGQIVYSEPRTRTQRSPGTHVFASDPCYEAADTQISDFSMTVDQ